MIKISDWDLAWARDDVCFYSAILIDKHQSLFDVLNSKKAIKGGYTQYPFLFVFFTFLLLREKVCDFSSAFLYVHIRTNQTVTYWTKVFRKHFFVKTYSSVLKYRSYRSYTKFLFIYNNLLSADMDL